MSGLSSKAIDRHVVWGDIDLDIEDWRDDLEAEYPGISEDDLYLKMHEINQEYLDDERVNLNIQLSQPIIVIGDLGRWNGRVMGYIRVFPKVMCNNKTALVLKAPKTKTSVRKVYLPNTVALMLIERKKQIEELKELFGEEYQDYNLVFAHPSGRPMEGQVITNALKKLIRENDLPDVVFHSFRHASITYKLKWTGGDMKAVQGDSGHARVEMVADVYSHILDDDRRKNAQRFDEQFYQGKALDGHHSEIPKPAFVSAEAIPRSQPESVPEPEPKEEGNTDDKEILLKLLANPEMAKLVKDLAANL